MSATDSEDPRLDFDDVRRMAAGRWLGILAALGIEVQFKRHHPCPGCGGTDRFRFDDLDGRGTFVCGGGGSVPLAGDGFTLIEHVRGGSVLEAFEAVAEVLAGVTVSKNAARTKSTPGVPMETGRTTKGPTGMRTHGIRLWLRGSHNMAAVTGHPYVQRKGFQHAFGCKVADGVKSSRWKGPQPCLLVPIRAHGTGAAIAVQAINPEGVKVSFGSMSAEDGTPGYLVLGNELDPKARRYCAEGWATAVAICFTMLQGNAAVAVSFGKSRLEKVAEQFQNDAPPGREVIIAEDAP